MTGKLPFDSCLTFTSALGGVLTEDLMPSKVSKDLPEWMDEVVKHTIVADPFKRWQEADEFIEFINNSMEEEQKKTIEAQNANSAGNTTSQTKVAYLKDMKPGVKVTPSMTLHEILGRGGFGRVFKVWHDMQKQYLAIKIFERDASVDNAINEFEALKSLHHPNIV
jgi:serine/threonine protein kinase